MCARLDVPLVVRRVAVDTADPAGVEAAARRERYAALAAAATEAGAVAVLLAHHQDDQAETLLVQLARGAGSHGLAAMPAARRDGSGRLWLRPFLGVPRREIDAWVRQHGIDYVDDDSNVESRHRRNALRQSVVPAFAAIFPGYPGTLARAAALQADAAKLLDELAAQDLESLAEGDRLHVQRLSRLSDHRARNALRLHFRRLDLRAPSSARLAAIALQLARSRNDAGTAFLHDGARFGVHRGWLVRHDAAPPPFACAWRGEPVLELPHGRLAFVAASGAGLAADATARAPIVVRSRVGGERLAIDPARPRRALKAWLRESGLAPWQRAALPLVFCGDALAAVPGVGVDVDFRAGPGAPGYALEWRPRT
jgi:tRNA(Ile)-lysidine synthase